MQPVGECLLANAKRKKKFTKLLNVTSRLYFSGSVDEAQLYACACPEVHSVQAQRGAAGQGRGGE